MIFYDDVCLSRRGSSEFYLFADSEAQTNWPTDKFELNYSYFRWQAVFDKHFE